MANRCKICDKKQGWEMNIFGSDDPEYICPECQENLRREEEERIPLLRGASAEIRVTTAFDLAGSVIVKDNGIVRGIIVRSRSVLGTVGASLQTIVGGDITLFTELCEQARKDAFEKMLLEAAKLAANGIIGMRYDATEIAQGVTEVLAYGTAVTIEPRKS